MTGFFNFSRYSKGIIFACIIALFVTQVSTHGFDPFHPKSITNDCIQTTVTMLEKNAWFVLLGIVASMALRRKSGEFSLRVRSINSPSGEDLFLLFDPLRRALREGRLRRLTYH